MKTIQDQKIEATLNKLINYEEGLMTRKKWLQLKKQQNCTVKEEIEPKYKYNRNVYNRLYGQECETYEKKMLGKKVTYNLYEAIKYSYSITKIEFNYFNTL